MMYCLLWYYFNQCQSEGTCEQNQNSGYIESFVLSQPYQIFKPFCAIKYHYNNTLGIREIYINKLNINFCYMIMTRVLKP